MIDDEKNKAHGAELRQRAMTRVAESPALAIESLGSLSIEALRQMLQESRRQQIELTMQNEELRRALDELGISQKRYAELYDLAPVGYCTVSEAGRISQANLSAAALLGVARGVLVKQPLTRFILKEDQDSYDLLRKQLIESGGSGETQCCDLRLLNNDGTPFWAQLAASLANDDDGAPVLRIVLNDISESKRITAELQQEQHFSKAILDSLPGIFYLYSYPDCRLVLWNQQYEKLLGYTDEDLAGKHVTDFHVPEFKAAVMNAVEEVMKFGQASVEAPLVAKDGHLVHFALTGVGLDAKDQSYFLGVGTDISENKKLENVQKEALGLLQKIASRVPGVVYQFRLRPDGSSCFPFASEALRDLYRLGAEEIREDASKMFAALHPDDLEEVRASVKQSAEDLTPWKRDYRVKFDDGTVRWLSGNAIPEREADGGVLWHGFITDITERKALEGQVRQMAFIDALTNLPNRRLLNDRLSHAMASSARSGCYGALMFLDLDNFKSLNDAYGHGVGDQLLVEAANRLKRCVREIDTVARFGGDEFVVMIGELEGGRAEATAKAWLVAEKMQSALSEPYALGVLREGMVETTIEHNCTASIGLNLFIGNDLNQEDIILGADKAMYQAKDAGRNSIQVAPELPSRIGLSKMAPTNFVQLSWHSDYECGHALIDNQHQDLLGGANRLISAILSERQKDEVSALIDVLVRDVAQHFRDEERILTAAGFHGAAEHSAIHRQLVERAIILVRRFRAGALAVGELFQFLAFELVFQHMINADREFFPYVKDGGAQVASPG